MRAFAFLSLAAVAFAAPAIVPGGSVATVVAPVKAPVDVVAGAVAHANAYVDAAVANVNANYNNVADNSLDHNNVNVARDIDVNKVGVNKIPVKVNAQNPKVNVLSGVHHERGLVTVIAPVVAILKALVALCAKVGVNAEAAIANIGFNYNDILVNSLNGNNVNVLSKRAAVDILTALVASIIACVNALVKAGVESNLIIGNVQAAANSIGNNSVNGNNVNVARDLIAAVAPVTAVVQAVLAIVAHVCADVTADILNIALNYNSILTNSLNANTINVL